MDFLTTTERHVQVKNSIKPKGDNMSDPLVTTWTTDQWLFGPRGFNDYMKRLKKNGANIDQIQKLMGVMHKFSDYDILHNLSDWTLGFLHNAASGIVRWANDTLNETSDAYIRTLLQLLIAQARLLMMMIDAVLEYRGIDLTTAMESDPFPAGPGPIVEQQ
jgi:hypothetical protein